MTPTAGYRPRSTSWSDALGGKLARAHIPALDAFRAVAVLLVMLYHFGFRINGALGVTMFFVLSGFLITWILLKETSTTGDISFRGFYFRRAIRIFPAFYAYILFGVAIYLVRDHEIPWQSVLAAGLYFQNYYHAWFQPGDSFVSHAWSLAIEEQFYLLWPLLFWRFRHDLRLLSQLLVGIILTIWIYRAVAWHLGVPGSYLYHAFETRADHLLIGCLLAITLKRQAATQFLRLLCARWFAPLVTCALLATSAYFYDLDNYKFAFGYALEPVLIALLIVQLIGLSDGPWGKLTENRVLRYLGAISYPLYLYQQLTLYTAGNITAGYPAGLRFAFAFAVTAAFASGSYFLVEKPFLRLKSRVSAVPHRPQPATKPVEGVD